MEDRPSRFGVYAPENFDLTFQGQVSARTALQQSLNIPAVTLLSEVGPARLLARLRNAGAQPVMPDGAPGLAIGLGGLGVTLVDLARLYAAFARGGRGARSDRASRSAAPRRARAARVRAGRLLVCRGRAAERAAPGQCARGQDLVQDRHVLRLSRRRRRGVRRAHDDCGVVRARGQRRRAGIARAPDRGAGAVRRLRARGGNL